MNIDTPKMADEPNNASTQQADKLTLSKDCDPKGMSKGEKWFERIVYQGLNYWANLGISLVVTDFFLHGKGNKSFKNGVERSTRWLTKTTPLQERGAKWLSEIALGTFSLNSGGNILLIPTKWLEDRKRPIVHWLNDKMGVDQTAPDGHKMTADEIHIECEQPKQSWPRMIGRRGLAWGSTTAVGLALDRVLRRNGTPGTEVFTKGTVDIAGKGLRGIGADQIADNPAVQRYMGYAALDWIYTIITSKVMHATNGAKKKQLPTEIDSTTPTPVPALVDNVSTDVQEPVAGKYAAAVGGRKDIKDYVKNKDDSFAATVSRQQLEAAPLQLS